MARAKGNPTRIIGLQDRGGEGEGRFRVRYCLDGRKLAKPFASRADAEKFIAEFRETSEGEENPTLGTLVEKYIEAKAKVDKPLWRAQKNHLKNMLGPISHLQQVNPEHIQAQYDRESKRLSVSTHQKALATTVQFFEWLVDNGIFRRNPAKRIEPKGTWDPERYQINRKADFQRFHAVTWDKAFHGCEKSLGILIALYLGIRNNEVTALQVKHFDFDESEPAVSIPGTKTVNAKRRLAVAHNLSELVKYRVLTAKLTDEDRIVPYTDSSLLKHVKKLALLAGVPEPEKMTVKACRAQVASLSNKGATLQREIAEFMGHASISTTMQYYASEASQAARRQGELARILATNEAQSWPVPETPAITDELE